MVYNSNNYGLWYLQRTSCWGESKPTERDRGRGPHIVELSPPSLDGKLHKIQQKLADYSR